MQPKYFEQFTNAELKEISKNLTSFPTVKYNNYEFKSVGNRVRKIGVDIEIKDESFLKLPIEIKTFIQKPNSETGNVPTRVNRCLSLLNKEVLRRFYL